MLGSEALALSCLPICTRSKQAPSKTRSSPAAAPSRYLVYDDIYVMY